MSKLLEQINSATKETKKLGEVFEIIDGDRGANYPSKSEFTKSGYCIFLNTKNVPSQGFDFSNVDYISKERDELLRKGKLTRNDIVMTTRGTIGNVALYAEDMPFDCVRINSGMVVLRAKSEYDRTYLYTLIKSDIFNAQLKNTSSGSAQPQLPIRDLREIEIDLPDLPTQQKIAGILSAYDAKIENNNKIIKNLEATAQIIFNEWFVNFRFPGYEKAKFVESEMGEIPEGWVMFKLKDIFTFIKGKKPAEVSEVQKEGFLQQILIDSFENGKKLFADKRGMVISSEEDLLMVMDGASSGRIEFGIAGVVGSTMSKLQLLKPIRSILYFFLKTNEKDIKDNTTGSAIPHTDKEKVYRYEIALPMDFESFEKILFGFIQSVEKLNMENIVLKQSRDQLLAKLI